MDEATSVTRGWVGSINYGTDATKKTIGFGFSAVTAKAWSPARFGGSEAGAVPAIA